MNIQWIGSPNYWSGRTEAIREVVIHWMVGTMAAADATFQNVATSTSAHYGIENGSVHQYVNEGDRAWHALQANPWTIGIEHSAAPGRAANDATYTTSAQLCADICIRYNLDPDVAIVPHSKYVATQCPGTMDLNRIKQDVKVILGGDMIQDTDQEFSRWKQLFQLIRGREPSRLEFQKAAVGFSWLKAMEILADSTEAVKTQEAQMTGQIAIRDNWQLTIKNLNERIAQMGVQMDTLRKDSTNKELADALQKRLDQTSAELADTVKKMKGLEAQRTEDTMLLNDAGNIFTRFLARFKK